MKVIAQANFLPGTAAGASSTAEFQFQNAAETPALAVISVPSGQLERRKFIVRAGGSVTGGTTTNFTAKIDHGTSTTISSNTTIADSGAIACDSESGNWVLEAELYLDQVSGKLQGRFHGWVNNTEKADTVLSSEIASLTAGTSVLSFNVTGTFSASHASNSAKLEFLELCV